MSDWEKGLPVDPGIYWLYSYRYGKESCGFENKPELQLAKVSEIANGVMIVADGQFVYEREVEQPHYKAALLPDLPELN
ncbi:MAG: hypothetical protein KAT04_14510 [Methylococcales bacterium]|nr:hypothetical protein [Methylococcales bacterium]